MSKRIPTLNWLRVFEVAARMESFSRAAKELNMSTSAVSQQISALETHLGSLLFERGARHVELTDDGHAFLPSVQQSLVSIQETATSLFGLNRTNTLRLQVVMIFATGWLNPKLSEFNLKHPEIQLHLNGAYYDTDYQRPGAEMRILFGPVHRSWAQCDRLFSESLYPVANQAMAKTIKTVDDLLANRLIQISTHTINWNQVLWSLGVNQVPSQQLSFTDTTDMALSLAAAGYGVALAREPTTNYLLEKLDLVVCDIASYSQSNEAYYLVYKNLESLTPAARVFREWLLDSCSNY